MAPHETEQKAQVGELLPDIPRHLAQQRAFAIDDFIVRERQHKVFGISIHQRKGEVVMMIAPVDWIQAPVFENFIEQAHVPLQPEAKSTRSGRTSPHCPGSSSFGIGRRSWPSPTARLVALAQTV